MTDRRDLLATLFAGAGLAAGAGALSSPAAAAPRPAQNSQATVVCLIRYQIDPYQKEAFRQYAESWGHIIPRCGGQLIGYFLPYEGTNDVAWALIGFASLAAYEAYRARLRTDPAARENFELAQTKRFILREERNFVEAAAGTLCLPPSGAD